MILTRNILIGSLIVLINLIPLLTKKYKLIAITGALSLLIVYLDFAIP
ncbi:MAG: hypothetical protein KJ592_04825 [Nanoarchaeota archaeon]|nr:hypothetical protein [Nanoarchaeota archaeon]